MSGGGGHAEEWMALEPVALVASPSAVAYCRLRGRDGARICDLFINPALAARIGPGEGMAIERSTDGRLKITGGGPFKRPLIKRSGASRVSIAAPPDAPDWAKATLAISFVDGAVILACPRWSEVPPVAHHVPRRSGPICAAPPAPPKSGPMAEAESHPVAQPAPGRRPKDRTPGKMEEAVDVVLALAKTFWTRDDKPFITKDLVEAADGLMSYYQVYQAVKTLEARGEVRLVPFKQARKPTVKHIWPPLTSKGAKPWPGPAEGEAPISTREGAGLLSRRGQRALEKGSEEAEMVLKARRAGDSWTVIAKHLDRSVVTIRLAYDPETAD